MSKKLYMLTIIAFALSFSTVSSAAAKVPATTTGIEKATSEHFAPVATSEGAIINLSPINGYDAQYVETYGLAKIHWVIDETFYANGYKALLNKEVKKIIAQPDNKNVNTITPLKRY